MIAFINTSFTTTLNHNRSSAQPLTAVDSLHSRSCSTTDCSLGTVLYNLWANPTENTVSQQVVRVFTVPLPRNGHPTVTQYAPAGMCLAIGMARITKRTRLAVPYCCVRVFRALPWNGATCHATFPLCILTVHGTYWKCKYTVTLFHRGSKVVLCLWFDRSYSCVSSPPATFVSIHDSYNLYCIPFHQHKELN
jgi:hypothetical protein